MRTRRCNNCVQYSPVSEWDWGCPACGWSNAHGEFVQVSEYPGVEVMNDIKPYRNMVDGREISSRSHHRNFLKDNNLNEVGNDVKYLTTPPQRHDVEPSHRHELIVAQVQAFGGETNLRRAVRKEVEFIRWNSRKD